jgi:hypothetical protein
VPEAATTSEFRALRLPSVSYRRSLRWLGLACILIGYVITVVRLDPTRFFGYIHDDTLYFSSAKAIAEGKGYVMPSVPGMPPATKYPVLYPWMLSWVWRWNPSFPANLRGAVALTVLFGLAFLTLIFVFLRQFQGITDGEALLITAFCALHPAVIFYGASVLPEIPFAVLALGAMVLAETCMRPGSSAKSAILCGILAGIGTQTRVIGVAIIAGISAAALLRRAWGQFSIFSASASVFLVPAMWRAFFGAPKTAQFAASAATNYGWSKAWAYYTDYPGFYRMCHPDMRSWTASLKSSATWLLRTPSDYFLLPSLARGGTFGLVVLLAVTGLVFAGIVRHARRYGWKPIHCALPVLAGIALLWNFNDDYRFFISFLPLFAAGYWLETKRIFGLARETLAKRRPTVEMAFGGTFVVLMVIGNLAMAGNFAGARKKLVAPIGTERAALLTDKREAYEWISRSTPRDARIVAYEDADLYLYTGRQAMRPIVFTTAEASEPQRMETALAHMTDVARTIGAGYWLKSDDDFNLESPAISQTAIRRRNNIERDLPLVFRSADGRVRIYGLGCMQHPEEVACNAGSRSGNATRDPGAKLVSVIH